MLHLVTDTVTNRAAARTASALGQQAKS